MVRAQLLFVITQMYRGGAETALLNLLRALSPEQYAVDLVVLSQPKSEGSLIGELPDWVRVCDAGAENIQHRFNMTREDLNMGGQTALRFVADRQYDFAFSYGEWCPPSFVAEHVRAGHKAFWIHTDITKSPTFEPNAFFDPFLRYQHYIFVSQLTMTRAQQRYPFIRGKSVLVHNLLDVKALVQRSRETVRDFSFPPCAVKLVTVANIRAEKGYPRMLATAELLRQRGVDFCWLCIGPDSDPLLAADIRQKAAAAGLERRFILLGGRSNPHPYTAMADAFVLLSDYEARPLAMEEALSLGKYAVATRTAGALELLSGKEYGILCGFEPAQAAGAIEQLFARGAPVPRQPQTDGDAQALAEFEQLIACGAADAAARKG